MNDLVRLTRGCAGPRVPRRWSDQTQIDGATVSAQLERWDPGTMLLVSRGFHWITERAFNR